MSFNKVITVYLLLIVFSVLFISDIHGKNRRKTLHEKSSDDGESRDESDKKVNGKKSTKFTVDKEQIFDVRKNEKKKSFNYYLPPDTMKTRIDKDKRKRQEKLLSKNNDFIAADGQDNNDRDMASSFDKNQKKNTITKNFEISQKNNSKNQHSATENPKKVTVIVENDGFEGVIGKKKAVGDSERGKNNADTSTKRLENNDDYDEDDYDDEDYDDNDYYDDDYDDDDYDDYDENDYDDDDYDDEDYDDDDYDDDDYDDDDYDDDDYDDEDYDDEDYDDDDYDDDA